MSLIEPHHAITKIIHTYLLVPGKRSSVLKLALDEYVENKNLGELIESLNIAEQLKSDKNLYDGHTLYCLHEQYLYDRDVKIWENMWPHHCAICKGQGIRYKHNYSHTPDEVEPCECTSYDEGKNPHCPRCWIEWPNEAVDDAGELTYNRIVAEELPCPSCHWNWLKENKTDVIDQDVLPDWPGCNCDSLEEIK